MPGFETGGFQLVFGVTGDIFGGAVDAPGKNGDFHVRSEAIKAAHYAAIAKSGRHAQLRRSRPSEKYSASGTTVEPVCHRADCPTATILVAGV
ncbi:hypothetical protein PXNS11_290076 [Stutzerimonas xanthomarina]|nr:hypothetical protein PXNS11_290076 [Stutzerimonas xanthomarina]